MSIKDNVMQLMDSIPKNVILVGVTKYSTRDEIEEAIGAGLKHIGENRVEAIEKIKGLGVKKHFIGNIQSNKINEIVENFDIIESVSSLEHLKKIDGLSKEPKEILMQLKISSDENKQGVKEDNLHNLLNEVKQLKNIQLIGFMMMASNTEDKETIREEFRKARQIFDRYKSEHGLKYLSMGMSNDYILAIEEGSNMIRVGSKIFKN